MFDKTLEAICEAFTARTERYYYRGRILHGGPDHKARMKAVSVFITLMEADAEERRALARRVFANCGNGYLIARSIHVSAAAPEAIGSPERWTRTCFRTPFASAII
jgi:hypothetical protein